jgi:hypothetical protein
METGTSVGPDSDRGAGAALIATSRGADSFIQSPDIISDRSSTSTSDPDTSSPTSSQQSSFQAQYASIPSHLRPRVITTIHEAVGQSHDRYTAWLESNVDRFSLPDRNELVGIINKFHGDAFHKLEDHKLTGYKGEVGDWESDLERLGEVCERLGMGPDLESAPSAV